MKPAITTFTRLRIWKRIQGSVSCATRVSMLGLFFGALMAPCTLAQVSAGGQIADDLNLSTDADLGRIRGVIQAEQNVVISSEIAARIAQINLRPGDRFNEGQLLVGFDCGLYQAELASARAELGAAQKVLQNKRELLRLDAAGAIDVELAAAEAEKARAEVRVKSVWVRRCTIKAPFSGRVVERAVNRFQSVTPDTPLLQIVDDRALEIEALVPSNWVEHLKKGSSFKFRVDETGRVYTVTLERVGAVVDPVSQTIKIYGRLKNVDEQSLPGMSGTLEFAGARR